MKKIIIFIFVILVNSCYVRFPNNIKNEINNINNKNTQIEFRKIISGVRSNINEYKTFIVNNEDEFEKLLRTHDNNYLNSLFIPKIDFNIKTVVGIFLGDKKTTGYLLDIDKIIEEKNEVKIYLKEILPQKGDNIKFEITQPFLIIEIPKVNKKISFVNIQNIENTILNYSIIDSGIDSNIKSFSTKIAKNEDEFLDIYIDHISSKKDTLHNFPKIDFNKNNIIGIFLGKKENNGYLIKIDNIIKTNSQIIIKASEIFMKPSNFEQNDTYPYIFFEIEKTDLPINFDISFIYSENNFNQNNPERKIELFSNLLLSGNDSNYSNNEYFLIKNNQDFQKIWNKHIADDNFKFVSLPSVDFSKNDLVAVFLGKKDKTGYSIKLRKIIETQNDLKIVIETFFDEQLFKNINSNPYAFFLIPKTNKSTIFILKEN